MELRYIKIKVVLELMKAQAENWPVLSGNYSIGNPSSNVAIVTITSKLKFPKELFAIVGEMKTENLGIERVIINTISNANIRYMVVCGKESKGHFAGQTLISIHENGIDEKGPYHLSRIFLSKQWRGSENRLKEWLT